MKKIDLTNYEIKSSEELKELIENKVENLYLKSGLCATERIDIELMLTDEQLELFYKIDLNNNYYWEKFDDMIYLAYTEKTYLERR